MSEREWQVCVSHSDGISPTLAHRHLRRLRSRRRPFQGDSFQEALQTNWYYIAERQSPQIRDLRVVNRRRTKMLAYIFASTRLALPLSLSAIICSDSDPRSWMMMTASNPHSLDDDGVYWH